MVSNGAIITMGLTGIIAVLLPFIFILVLRKKFKIQWLPIIIGAVTFIVFAQILEQISHFFVLRPGVDGSVQLMETLPWLYVLYGILAAGIFEETGRLVAFLLMKRKYHTRDTAVSYGIGHGGIEAILVVGFGMVSTIVYALMINSGSDVLGALPVEIENAVVNTPVYMYGAAIIERVIAMIFHIGLSVIVFAAVMKKGKWWLYLVAIALHALGNLTAAMMQAGIITSLGWVYPGLIIAVVLTLWIAKKVMEGLDARPSV
jgi:uncharacterized membrane protein YhfC